MKKVITLLSVLFASLGLANAQTLSIPDIEIAQGKTASFNLVIDVPEKSYVGFQFETVFGSAKLNYTGKTTVSPNWDGAFSTSAINYKGSSRSDNLTPIPSGEIAIATVEIEAAADLDFGVYDVTIKNFEFLGYTGGAADKMIDDVTFKVTVTDRITLDEEATVAPSAASGVNVKVKRTISAGEWSTICLPFDMEEDQVKAIFGNDVQLAEYIDHDVDNADITINFESADLAKYGLAANVPYIIKTSKGINDFVLDNVYIDPDVAEAEYTNGKNGNRKEVYGIFKGTYQAQTVVPTNCLFISDNKFYSSTGMTKMKAFRAYFEILNGPSAARVKMSVTDRNGNTTNIDARTMQTIEDGKVYNMNGQYVGEAEDANSLPKGVYIVNGKKKVIK